MDKQIIWSPQAVADRIQILDYWYKRLGAKKYSAKLDERFRNAVKLLSRYPFLGRQIPKKNIRVLIIEHHKFFYMADDEFIKILHIWDTRRNPDDMNI